MEGGIVEHIESKEFILQLKTPRRDVIIHVKELIRVASLFPTECDDSEKDTYPKILLANNKWNVSRMSQIFWSKSSNLYELNYAVDC